MGLYTIVVPPSVSVCIVDTSENVLATGMFDTSTVVLVLVLVMEITTSPSEDAFAVAKRKDWLGIMLVKLGTPLIPVVVKPITTTDRPLDCETYVTDAGQ